MSLLSTLNNFHAFFSVTIADYISNVFRGALSCVNIASQSLYSNSKDEKMLYLTLFKLAADFLND